MVKKNKDDTDDIKTIYVVTSGEYSDYRIEGVFSTEEKANLFADKTNDRTVEEYDLDDPEMLSKKDWYKVKVYISPFRINQAFVEDLWWTENENYFDSVKFTKTESGDRFFTFFLKALDRKKAKAIALERFHALLAVEQTHFPMLRWVRRKNDFCICDIQESLVFGYFDYKAYFAPTSHESVKKLFLKIVDHLPKPMTDEEKDNIDWQNLTDDSYLQLIKEHGLDIEYKANLPKSYYNSIF